MSYAYLQSQFQGLYGNNIDVMAEREHVRCILRGIRMFGCWFRHGELCVILIMYISFCTRKMQN